MITPNSPAKSLLNTLDQRLKSFRSYHAHPLFDQMSHPDTASLNSSLHACVHRNRHSQALTLFKNHVKSKFADRVAVALALKACRGDLQRGRQIHGFAVSSGLVLCLPVSNSLMNVYCKCGQFDRAVAIFETLSSPDTVSWNTVLSGFSGSEGAFSFALRMNRLGSAFDAVTYTTLLSFCLDHGGFFFGFQLHSPILKCGLHCEVYVGNALITMYSRWGLLSEAQEVFDTMPHRDLVSWNALISGYTQDGDYPLEAILNFIELVRLGMKLDHVSFAAAISACGHERMLGLGKQIHGLAIKYACGTHVSVCNVLITLYSRCQTIEDAKAVLGSMIDRNVVSWTTMISMNKDEAVSLFNEMRKDGVFPNEVTFVGLLNAISNRNLAEEGRMVHGFCAKTGFVLEKHVLNSLITLYAKLQSMEDALKIFHEVNHREIISWNSLISGYDQNGLYEEALQTFFLAIRESEPNPHTFGSVLSAIGAAEAISMRHGERCHSHIIKLGLNTLPIVSSALLDMYGKRGSICESEKVFRETSRSNQVAWTAIICAYSRHGDFGSVMRLFEEMEREGVVPDSITFLAVLTACGHNGMVDVGHRVFKSMVEDYSIQPSAEHYSCVVDMFGRSGRLEEAEELVGQIPGGPGLSVLLSLLGACRIHRNVEMAEKVAKVLMEMEPALSGSYVLMSNLYAEKGEWEEVAKLRKGMKRRGVRKEVGFSWVDVGSVDDSLQLPGFSSDDKTHPRTEEIYKMVDCISSEMLFRE